MRFAQYLTFAAVMLTGSPVLAADLVASTDVCSVSETARLINVRGDVSVSSGRGFTPASTGQTVASGTTVRTGLDGTLIVIGDNGCQVAVGSGSSVLLGSDAIVSAGAGAGVGAGALGSIVPVGAGIAAIAVGSIVLLSIDDDDEPASP